MQRQPASTSNDESTPQETTIVLIGKELETKIQETFQTLNKIATRKLFLRNGGPYIMEN